MSTGIDINKKRLDDLDRIIIRDSLTEPYEKKTICNYGSGESILSRALATLGHRVYNYDYKNLSLFFNLQSEQGLTIYFTQIDLSNIKKHHLPKRIDMAVFQRVLHYLSYKTAHKLLETTISRLVTGGTLYCSFTGIDSNIGRTYSATDMPLEIRWGTIGEQDQIDFNITKPVCLYSQDDVITLFASIKGITIEKIWVSQFGNIKIVARKL